MRHLHFTRSHALVGTLFTILSALTVIAQQGNPPAQQPVPKIRVINYGGDLRAFLGHLPRSFDVTIGFEVDPAQPNSYVKLEVYDPTIDDVCAALVKSRPNYTWRRDDRFVDVSPSEGATPFLDTIVSSFEGKEVSQSEALRELFNKAEVQAAMGRFGLTLVPAISKSNEMRNITAINGSGLSVRQILHQIATVSGARIWVFRRSGPRNQQIMIEIPTN